MTREEQLNIQRIFDLEVRSGQRDKTIKICRCEEACEYCGNHGTVNDYPICRICGRAAGETPD